MLKTFKPGQAVLYKPKDPSGKFVYKIEAGIVKRMSDEGYIAFVWYHSGCTAAATPVEYLEATDLTNDHAFIHKGCSQCGYPEKMKCEHCDKDIEDYYFERDDGHPIYCMDCGYNILTDSVYGYYDYEATGVDLDEEAFDDDLTNVSFYLIKKKGE